MARSQVKAITQDCPNCGKTHDVGVYVSGQQVACGCGIRFEVHRSDVSAAPGRKYQPTVGARPPAEAEPSAAFDKTVASSQSGAQSAQTGVSKPPEVAGYELLELLGRGGMGEVWKARQLSLGRVVALKVLPEKFSSDPEFVLRFEKEATALASLSHPNIVQIIDRGQSGGFVYFTMELVPGINLRELMTSGKLSLRDALRIGSQVARAIDYAHEQRVVHRDLKPENILVDARGHVKIADFGLAGMQGNERDIALTATAVAMGTVNYMAPEQRRDAKNVSNRADLYSLGVILYEMLTGELPIGRFKPPSQKVPGLDPALDQVVEPLLETDPEGRPERALETAVALEELTPPAPESSSRLVARHRSQAAPTGLSSLAPASNGWRAGLIALGALLVAGLVFKLWPEAPKTAATSAPRWYSDTHAWLYSSNSFEDGRLKLNFDIADPNNGEPLSVQSGRWSLGNGVLQATQYGEPTVAGSLVPRAYIKDRYWVSDDFDASVDVEMAPLSASFPPVDPETEQRFAELAFRIKDLQVSIFAIPGTDLRLGWRYFTPDGVERQGNSTRDLDGAPGAEAVKVPAGRFRLRLKLAKTKKGDVEVQAWVDKTRFVSTVLPGLGGQVGKLALGCRNMVCRFDDVEVQGKSAVQPARFREAPEN